MDMKVLKNRNGETMPPRYSDFLKRMMDLVLTVPIVVITLPLVGICALVIRIAMGGPVLFRQKRIGLRGQPFLIRKFRTMRHATDQTGALLPDSERLTALGRILRKSSFDELPQLWNVLTGEMSLVGPRPLLPQYLPRYSPIQRRRHECLPGITGWAQIRGRNTLSWERRLELDVWYVDHRSFWFDLRILVETLWIVCSGAGTNQPGHATMPEFMPAKDIRNE
jgi:sugar transferase EpsL